MLTAKFGAENSPLSFEVNVLITLFFETSVIVIVAPGTQAPEASRTVPTIEPVISCANEAVVNVIIEIKTIVNKTKFCFKK